MALLLASIMQNSGLELFVSAPSAMIVLGGTIAATLVAYPINELFGVMGLFLKVFVTKKRNMYDLIDTMVMICSVARKGGVLAIESRMDEVDHGFLKRGLLYTVDGKDEQTVLTLLKKEIRQIQERHRDGWEIMSEMGKFAPAFGMVGTLIGLIQMLSALDDVKTVGPKMAVALITTFYGALLANLVFIPMTVKLKRRSAAETLEMKLVLEGITFIRKGVNPRFMKETLENILENAIGKKEKREAGVAPPPGAKPASQPPPKNQKPEGGHGRPRRNP